MLANFAFAYLDGPIIASKGPETHLKTLQAVFHLLQEAGLKAKLSKFEFSKEKIKFLGHEVDRKGIHTSDDKIMSVKNFPKPQSANNVHSSLWLVGYYWPFIHNLAGKAALLTRILRKESTFHWGATQEKFPRTKIRAHTYSFFSHMAYGNCRLFWDLLKWPSPCLCRHLIYSGSHLAHVAASELPSHEDIEALMDNIWVNLNHLANERKNLATWWGF